MGFVVLISIGDLEMDRQTDGHTHSLHHNIDVVNYDSQIKILKPCIKSVAKIFINCLKIREFQICA